VNTRGVAALCAAAVLLLAGCTKTAEPDAGDKAAAEAEKLRSALPTTTPTPEPSAPVSAPPQPAALVKNPIYRVGKLGASECEEPAVPATSLANVRSYYTQYVVCLNDVWAPAILEAGFKFAVPKLVVVLGQSPSSPCDVEDRWAYYCGDTIYVDAELDIESYKKDPAWARAEMALLIGHEYGHHIQALTGILDAQYQRGLQLNGVDLQLEESRRLELQASCFSAAYIGANQEYFPADEDWLEVWDEVIAASDDPDRDHGSAGNHAHWIDEGFEAGGPAACNTYNADSVFVA
jgi:uncharacterized protein